MSESTPNVPMLIKLIARFIHKDTGQPVDDPGYRVQFYDHDVVKDDFLGESGLRSDGVAEIIFDGETFQTGLLGKIFERLKEQKPDVYCQIVDIEDKSIFRSTIRWDVDVTQFDEVTKRPRSTVDLGTFEFLVGDGLQDPYHYSGILRPML